jgi:uncharacterized protein YvpB
VLTIQTNNNSAWKEEKLLKKLYFLISLLPLLGCSNSDTNEQATRISKAHHAPAPIQTEQIRNRIKMNSEPVKIKQRTSQQATAQKNSAMLNVALIKQNPELKYGCEVTSLAMVLNYAGVKINKMELYHAIQKDSDPLIRSARGDIIRWGNPSHGFVGDMTGHRPGYAVFDQPMIQLINKYLPGRAVNLTNQPFENVLNHVAKGYPIVVWTTGDYRLPDRWESWYHGQQLIKTPLDLHAVVLVGYDAQYVYLNDPLSGRKQVKVEKQQFIASWKALNCRAVSYL